MRFVSFLLIACTGTWFPSFGGDTALVEVLPARAKISLTGYTRARAQIAVSTEVSGRCETVLAEVGQTIGPDGVFAHLDATFTRLDLERNLKEQERLKNQEQLKVSDAKRFRKLYEEETVSLSRYEEAQTAYDQVRLQRESLIIEEKVLRERLERFTITIPTGWRVMERNLEPGAWTPQGTVVARAGDYQTLYVPFSVDERVLAWLQSNRDLQLRLPGDTRIKARVARISPEFDVQTRKTMVDLAIDGKTAGHRGGVRVVLEVESLITEGEVLVPEIAVTRRYDDYWVTPADGEPVRVRLLGTAPPDLLRVSGPLKSGDRLRVDSGQ